MPLEEILPGVTWVFPLVFLRVAVVLRLTPPFGGRELPVVVWLGLAGLVSLVIFFGHSSAHDPPDLVSWCVLLMKELLLGYVIGASVRTVFSLLEMLGQLVGISMNAFLWISTGDRESNSPWERFMLLFGIVMFFAVGGHHGLLDGLSATFHCFPPQQTLVSGDIWREIAANFQELVAVLIGTAVLLAAPVYLAGLVADVVGAILLTLLPLSGSRPSFGVFRVVLVQGVFLAALSMIISGAIEIIGDSVRELRVCGL